MVRFPYWLLVRFPYWLFFLFTGKFAGTFCYCLGFFHGGDPLPIVERVGSLGDRARREQEFLRTPVVSRVRPLSLVGDDDEAERF